MQSDQNFPEMHDIIGLSFVLANIGFEISSLHVHFENQLASVSGVLLRIGMPKYYFHFKCSQLREKKSCKI